MQQCPICGSNAKILFELPMGNFDNSKLYKTIELMSCTYCGHVFNAVDDVSALKQYYNTEYRDFIKNGDERKDKDEIYGIDTLFDYISFMESKEYNQKLEHSINPKQILIDLSKLLKQGEIFTLSIPDASRYQETEPFNFYWLALREHVQHFDLAHILMLAELCKFELVSYKQNEYEIVGKYMMPNLDIVLRYNPESKIKYRKNLFELEYKMMNYVLKQEVARNTILLKVNGRKNIYCYGISREFMYAYENLGLKNYDITLIDDTPIKQEKYTVDRKPIQSSDILKDAPTESCLIITAIAHKETLKAKALELGYKGEIIDL
jgi:hypothetical protein